MNHERERDQVVYIFDARGYVVQPGFLDPDQVARAREQMAKLAFSRDEWHEGQERASDLHGEAGFLGELANRLYRHPTTGLAIGYPHRLLESYALARTLGTLDLHGGASEFIVGSEARDISGRSWSQGGRTYALRVKVLVYLDDIVLPEDGRPAYVEGSHKADHAFHRAFPGGRDEAADLLRTISVRAGDAVWLNEGLLHGAERKSSSTPRRLLAYTFGPTFMAPWSELGEQSISAAGYPPMETER